MGPSRSCCNGTTSALQPEEIISKGTRVSTINKSAHTKKVWQLIVRSSYIIYIGFVNRFKRYILLNDVTDQFRTLQFSKCHLFAYSLNVKKFYLTNR